MLLTGALIGLFSAVLSDMVDDWMQYGKILHWLRRWRVTRTMKRQGFTDDNISGMFDFGTFDDRHNQFVAMQWEMATVDFWLTGWICTVCMAIRINIVMLVSAWFMLPNPDNSLIGIFGYIVAGFATCHLVSRIIAKL